MSISNLIPNIAINHRACGTGLKTAARFLAGYGGRYASKTMKTLFIILLTVGLSQNALASKEGVLPLSEFQVHSNGIASSGKISVFGKQNENGAYTEVRIEAFGKKIFIPKAVLAQIPSNYQNGIQLSYEHGYKVLGGKVIYLKFSKGFVNTNLNSIVIRVRENGNVDVLSKSEP